MAKYARVISSVSLGAVTQGAPGGLPADGLAGAGHYENRGRRL